MRPNDDKALANYNALRQRVRDGIPTWQAVAIIALLWPLWVVVLLLAWAESLVDGRDEEE